MPVARDDGGAIGAGATGAEALVGGGIVSVRCIDGLAALVPFIGEARQTIIHAGFEAEALAGFAAETGTPGLCRIVPVGQVLQFDWLWDVYDLFGELTRLIVLR